MIENAQSNEPALKQQFLVRAKAMSELPEVFRCQKVTQLLCEMLALGVRDEAEIFQTVYGDPGGREYWGAHLSEPIGAYPACEKLEIIRLVEQSHLPVRRTLDKLGIQPARFYRWYDRLQTGGPRRWKTRHQGRSTSGTASPRQYANGSFSWPWMSRSYHHGNWPHALPIRPTTLYQKLRSIGCSRRMI